MAYGELDLWLIDTWSTTSKPSGNSVIGLAPARMACSTGSSLGGPSEWLVRPGVRRMVRTLFNPSADYPFECVAPMVSHCQENGEGVEARPARRSPWVWRSQW